jgi:ribosomal protein L29
MQAEDIREMGEADIRQRIGELEEERFRLQFRAATETLEDPLRLRVIRRDIARLRTVLVEKGAQGAQEAVPARPVTSAEAQAPARKTAAKKSTRKTRSSRKSAAKKTTARKSAAKKTTAKKAARKSTGTKRTTAKKTGTKKAGARKSTRKARG